MALEFSSTSGLVKRMGSDHQVHMRSMASTLARAIAKTLNDRTVAVDGRNRARARVGSIRAASTATGGTKYSITVTQNILPDVKDAKKKKIQLTHSALRNQLSSKNGVIGLLGSGGVH